MTAIEKFVDFLVTGAPARWRQATRSGRCELLTFFHLLLPTGDHEVYAFQIADAAEKAFSIGHVRRESYTKHAVAVGVLFEAWVASEIHGDSRLPSERDDRREVLMLCIQRADRSGEAIHSWEIQRVSKRRAELGPHLEAHELMGGMFQELLRPRGAAHSNGE